jgi:endonuclease YncB( thermonuclease family)
VKSLFARPLAGALRTALALCLLLSAAASAETLHGVVFVVIDGDTVLFKPDRVGASPRAFLKIRLADIDAPEKEQAYGDAATRLLTTLVLKQQVTVDSVATDHYGRTVAKLRLAASPPDAATVNQQLVQRGLAWGISRYRHTPELRAAQAEARRAQRGLWQDPAPTPPWVWRRTHAVPSLEN